MRQEVKKLKVSIKNFGCQMNEYDSQVAAGLLEAGGFTIVGDSPLRGQSPDVVLLNTCSVRAHAEERVYGRLGMLGKAKKRNPNLIVGVMGCMVEEHREKLFKRFPQLDFMVGTRNIKELPEVLEEVRTRREQVARIKRDGISIEYTDLIHRASRFHAWLPVMTGCNKVCTFCIVPITRGAEVSMPAREVYREASRLVAEGVKWITLLGQNVNSYRGDDVGGRGVLQYAPTSTTFPDLLRSLCQIEGLERISFTTSHPSDATEELFQVIARNPKISRRFHLPLQSGSDRILKRMKRLHTYEGYKQKIDRLRELVPEISITTDIIVGFSGETEEDYQMTRRTLEEIRYDGAYLFKYSVRAGTPAAKLPDDVPLEIKEARHRELLVLQRRISIEKNRSRLGQTLEVFVEGRSAKRGDELLGRTLQEKKVIFPAPWDLIGTFQQVTLLGLQGETFMGRLT